MLAGAAAGCTGLARSGSLPPAVGPAALLARSGAGLAFSVSADTDGCAGVTDVVLAGGAAEAAESNGLGRPAGVGPVVDSPRSGLRLESAGNGECWCSEASAWIARTAVCTGCCFGTASRLPESERCRVASEPASRSARGPPFAAAEPETLPLSVCCGRSWSRRDRSLRSERGSCRVGLRLAAS